MKENRFKDWSCVDWKVSEKIGKEFEYKIKKSLTKELNKLFLQTWHPINDYLNEMYFEWMFGFFKRVNPKIEFNLNARDNSIDFYCQLVPNDDEGVFEIKTSVDDIIKQAHLYHDADERKVIADRLCEMADKLREG